MSLTSTVKAEALRLGFHLAGVTTPEPPPHLPVYQDWLRLGRHGGMAYLASERSIRCRADPHLILPECRSILVLAIRYPDPASIPPAPAPFGRVAAYAWGQDYHILLLERLQALAAFIEAQTGHSVPQRAYTDTSPLLERELAQRAGLGWIGKNTCLINPRAGSYFLLAEILLGVDLDPDPPFTADRCGKCTRCIRACPTGCILPDRTLDARRCISYLTIEEKGSIPDDLRPSISNWVFGCDICQLVCPWNRFSAPSYELAFGAAHGLPNVDLRQELLLTSREFNQKYASSSLQRARRKRYVRNIIVGLGNQRDMASLPALKELLYSDDPLIREHALWAIAQIQGK